MKPKRDEARGAVELVDTVCRFLVFAVFLIPGISQAGGWNSSGGGGIACFANAKIAAAAARSGIIRDEYVHRILTLHTIEMDGLLRGLNLRKQDMVTTEQEEPAQDFAIRLINEKVRPHVPQAASNLEAALKRIAFESWIPVRGLPVLPDYGAEVLEAPERRCRYVQLVLRYSKPGAPGAMDEVRVEYDIRLIEHMKKTQKPWMFKLNLSALLLHEAVYYLNFDNGREENSSVQTQTLVSLLLRQQFWHHMDIKKDPASQEAFAKLMERMRLNRVFWDAYGGVAE